MLYIYIYYIFILKILRIYSGGIYKFGDFFLENKDKKNFFKKVLRFVSAGLLCITFVNHALDE